MSEIKEVFEENSISDEQMLRYINDAIKAIAVGGQSYKIGSRSLTRANLTDLVALKKELESRVNQSGESPFFNNTYVALFEGR